MELELGLKITKTRDEIDSISEYQFMKDAGPVFHSRETNTMFILTANLKGYKRSNIDIKISKDGSKISIIGKKPIQEMVMMGWVMQRKVVDVKGFNKVFKIPHGVNLDKIKANHNEEEWMLSIFMPKLVKGICGLKIEEYKEQETSEIDHVSSSCGETSQKGSKDYEFQCMEGGENVIEKMLDDVKKEIDKEIITQKEVMRSKLRSDDGDDVNRSIREKEEAKLRIEDSKIKDMREKDGKETCEALKTFEDMEMLNETNKKINEETKQKEVGDSKVKIEDGNGESAREKVGKEEYEVMKKSEQDRGVGVFVTSKIEDTGKDKEFEDQKVDSRSVDKRHDDGIIGGKIKEEEKEESKSRVEDIKVKDLGKGISHSIVDTSQRVFEESMIQQSGESRQKESKEPFEESEKENIMEPFEAMKVLELEQNVVDHIPSNNGCVNQNEFGGSRIPLVEKTKSTKGKMNGGGYEKLPFEANGDFQKEVIKPKMKTKDRDQGCVLEKLVGKEGFDDGMVIIKKEFPDNLPMSSSKDNEGVDIEKMKETKNVKEEMVIKKVEYFVEKGESERFKSTREEVNKGSDTRDTMQEEIEVRENELKENGQEQFAGIKGSKGFNFANKEEENKVSKEALVENESLMVEGEEYKERTMEIVQDEKDKFEYDVVKLKGEGSTMIDGEPTESFEGENVNIGIFDGSKTQKFQENEQTEDEDVNEEGADIEKYMNKVNTHKHEKVQNEENEGFKKNTIKEKDKCFLEEEMSKGRSKEIKDAKEEFAVKMFDSPIDTREGLKNTRIEKIKGIKESVKESSTKPFEAMKVSKHEPFEANDDIHKDFIKSKVEEKYGEKECVGKRPSKEGFDAKMNINEKFFKNLPESTNDEIEGLNVLKMQETKEVKENMVKRKGKEIDYFKENGEGDRFKRMDVEATIVDNTRETMPEEIENSENGIKRGEQQQVAEMKGSKRFNVSKEEEEEFKKRSESIEQEEGISHSSGNTSQRIFEESLIQQSGDSKQKEIEGSKCDSMERLEEILKEDTLEQSLVDHIHGNNGCIDPNEFREPMFQQMEKTKITKERKNGGMDSEKTPFEVNEDVQKNMFGDAIQNKIIKMNADFPKNLPKNGIDESEGLDVQKMQETKNVKEEMVDRKIEYFVENGDGERFKKMHVTTKKGNTRETMHKEIKKNENKVKENGQQHAKENAIKEMDEVSKNVIGELRQKVLEINESKEFNVAKEEEQKEVTRQAFVESESLIEKVEGEESKEKTKSKKVQDEEDKIGFGIVQLKGEGPTKIHVDGINTHNFQEEESEDVNENGEKTEKLEKKMNEKTQHEEDKVFKKNKTTKKHEGYFPEEVSEGRFQETKVAKEYFPTKMLDSQIDTREELKDRKIEKIKCVKEESELKERTKTIVKDEEDKIEYGIVELRGEVSTKITHKFQENGEIEDDNGKGAKTEKFAKKGNEKIQNVEDESFNKNTTKENFEYFLQDEMSKGRSKASKATNEPFEDRIEKEISNQKLESFEELVEKENVDIGIFDGRKIKMFQEMKQSQDTKEKGANSEKTMNKVSGSKYENIQNEEIDGFKKKITKEKDECYLEGVMSKGRSQESKDENEDKFSMNLFDSPADSKEGLKGRKIEKTTCVKEESKNVKQVEANEGLRNDIEEQNCGESTTKEELQESKIERIGTPEREFKSVECIGFKEFDYECEKDKKQKKNMLPQKFEGKKIHESNDESSNQENLSPKKLEEKCTVGIENTKEVETKEDQVIKPISVPRLQSEVEEKEKFCEDNEANYNECRESKKDDPTKDFENLIEMKEKLEKKEEKSELHNREKVGETMLEKSDEPEKKIDDGEQESLARDDGKVETKEIDKIKEHQITQNVDVEKCEMDGEIAKSSIEEVDKKKWIHDTMKTTLEKEHSVKFEVDEEKESLNEGLKNDSAEMKTKRLLELRNNEDHGYKTKEIKALKIATYEGDKPSKLQRKRINQQFKDEATKESPKLNIVETEKIDSFHPQLQGPKILTLDRGQQYVQEKNVERGFETSKAIEEEEVVKKREKVAKSEEGKDASSQKKESEKTTQTTEEKKPKMKEITQQVEKASESKRVAEKVHETLKRKHQRESEEFTSKMEVEPSTTFEKTSTKVQRKEPHEFTKPPNMHYEIPKETELRKEEEQKHIRVLEASISKVKDDRDQEHVQEKNDKKGFQTPKTVEAEKVLKKREGPNFAKSEEEKKTESEGPMVPRGVAAKVHETPKRELKRETKESICKIEVEPPTISERKEAHELTRSPNMNEIPKEWYINVPEATISKGEGTQVTTTNTKAKQRVEQKDEIDNLQENQIPSSKEPFHSIENTTTLEVVADNEAQQFEVEGKLKPKENESKLDVQDSTKSKRDQVVKQCINKDEEAEHGIKEQKEGKDETSAGKMDNAKISKTVEEEKILKKREGPKVAKSGEEKKPKMKEITPQFDLASESKRVSEKVHETSEEVHETSEEVHEHENKPEESTSKFERKEAHELRMPLNMDNEIPKVKELQKEEIPRNILVSEPTISKEDATQAKATNSKEEVSQQSKVLTSLCTQQLEVEGEEKTKKKECKMTCQEVEQCINKEEEAKHEIEEIEEEKDYDQVYEEQKESKDETSGGKKENAKISKKLLVPLVIAGSTLLATLAFIFVRHRRSRKM